jgi:NAD+ kinase
MRLGLLANLDKSGAAAALRQAGELATRHGFHPVVPGEPAVDCPGAQVVPVGQFGRSIDFLMTFGGDGTLLSGVRMLAGADVPVLGVNLGKLGFMTGVSRERLAEAFTHLARGDFSCSDRALLACVVRDAAGARSFTALNDVVLAWGASSRLATVSVRVDDEPVTTYTCDGLIVATPTGSTGHSLSAGGPILHPATPAFVVSVICPHTMSVRPLVVPDTCVIRLGLDAVSKPLVLSVDGRPEPEVAPGVEVEVRRSPARARLAHLPGYSYFEMLRHKLNWRGSAL